tara:strand:+ start:201 stop:959 length:759 start_codon:yes stop_codon:yes gene_type:complete
MKRSKRNNRTNKNRKGNRRLVRKKIQAGGPGGEKIKAKATIQLADPGMVDYSGVKPRVNTKGPKRKKSKSKLKGPKPPPVSFPPLAGAPTTPELGPGTGELSSSPLAPAEPTTPEPDSLSSFLTRHGYVLDSMNQLPSGVINTVLEDVDRYINEKKEDQDQSSRVQLLTISELIDVHSDVFTSANVIEMLVQMDDGKPIEYEHQEIIKNAYTQAVAKNNALRTRESPDHTLPTITQVPSPVTYHTRGSFPPI